MSITTTRELGPGPIRVPILNLSGTRRADIQLVVAKYGLDHPDDRKWDFRLPKPELEALIDRLYEQGKLPPAAVKELTGA